MRFNIIADNTIKVNSYVPVSATLDYVQKSDGTYCAIYQSNGTIKKLNTINGSSFSIYKNGTDLVSGREWYSYNYDNNKLYYFNNNKSYNVSDILENNIEPEAHNG